MGVGEGAELIRTPKALRPKGVRKMNSNQRLVLALGLIAMACVWALFQPQKVELIIPGADLAHVSHRRATAWEGRKVQFKTTGLVGYFELDHTRFLTECAVIGAATGAFILLLGLDKSKEKETT